MLQDWGKISPAPAPAHVQPDCDSRDLGGTYLRTDESFDVEVLYRSEEGMYDKTGHCDLDYLD